MLTVACCCTITADVYAKGRSLACVPRVAHTAPFLRSHSHRCAGVRAWQDDYPVFPTQTATSSPTPTPTRACPLLFPVHQNPQPVAPPSHLGQGAQSTQGTGRRSHRPYPSPALAHCSARCSHHHHQPHQHSFTHYYAYLQRWRLSLPYAHWVSLPACLPLASPFDAQPASHTTPLISMRSHCQSQSQSHHCSTPTGTPTPTPSSSPLPWFDVVAAIRNEPELTFFNDLLDYQPNLPQLWQMMDPTVWAPTNGAFHHLFKRFPAFLEWLLGYPSCFAFNRLEYFLQTHATALYVPKFSVVTAPLRTRLVRTMAPHPEELLKLVAARVQVLDDADDAASSLGGILRRLEAPTDADTTSSATDPTVPWAVSAEERKLQSSFAAHTVRKSGVERQLIVNTETGPSSENDYRIVVDTARNWNLYRSPRELASGYVANGFLYAIDRVIKPSADARATFPDQSLLQFVSEHPALTEFAALLRYADIQCVSDFAQEGYTYHDAGRIWVAGDDVEADHTYGGWDWGATNRSHYARRRCNADIHAITIFRE